MSKTFLAIISIAVLVSGVAWSQMTAAPGGTAPGTAVPIDAQLNNLLSQLQQASQDASSSIGRLRIEKWKTDGSTKQQAQSSADALQRNFNSAMPGLIASVRQNPSDIAANFKLYRNLNVVYDYFTSLAENAGAFGAKGEYDPLVQEAAALDSTRRTLADRLELLTSQTSGELERLRAQVRARAQSAQQAPPKKIIVDDNEPPKKSTKKKPVKPATKPATNANQQTTKPSGQNPQ